MSYKHLSKKKIAKIVEKLEGTSGVGENNICEEYDLSMEDLEELMLDNNYGRCPECEWWCECGELVDEDGEPCECTSCRPTKDD